MRGAESESTAMPNERECQWLAVWLVSRMGSDIMVRMEDWIIRLRHKYCRGVIFEEIAMAKEIKSTVSIVVGLRSGLSLLRGCVRWRQGVQVQRLLRRQIGREGAWWWGQMGR